MISPTPEQKDAYIRESIEAAAERFAERARRASDARLSLSAWQVFKLIRAAFKGQPARKVNL